MFRSRRGLDPPISSVRQSHEGNTVLSESEDNVEYSVLANKNQNNPNDEDMTNLVKLQTSNGMFEMKKEKWENSVFEKYSGTFENVNSSCPNDTDLHKWITALAIQILELHMKDKKELWKVVAEKSKKYLLMEIENNDGNYKNLIDKAEEYVTKQSS